jgi:hypothetical protein
MGLIKYFQWNLNGADGQGRPNINKAAIAGGIFSGREKGSFLFRPSSGQIGDEFINDVSARIGLKKISLWPINNKSTPRDL